MDMTADKLGDSPTRAVVRGSVVVGTDVGARVAGAATITAAEDIIYDVVTQDSDIRGRHGSSITTAIDIFNAGHVAALDDDLSTGCINLRRIPFHCRIQFCIRRSVVGLVTAAIDGSHIVGGAGVTRCLHRFRAIYRALYMHLDMPLRRAVQVVGTEDLTCYRLVIYTLACIIVHQLRTIEQHVDIAAHIGQDVAGGTVLSVLLSETATEDITVDSAAIEVDIRDLGRIKHQGIHRPAGSCVTQSRTTIDITIDDGCAGIGRRCGGRCRRHRADVHRHIAVHQRRHTLTTAEDPIDNLRDGIGSRTHGAAEQRHRGIRLHHAIHVGTAIDSRLDKGLLVVVVFDVHGRVTEVLRYDTG